MSDSAVERLNELLAAGDDGRVLSRDVIASLRDDVATNPFRHAADDVAQLAIAILDLDERIRAIEHRLG